MSRKEEIERIIIGTLLSGREVFAECASNITPDMFSNDDNRRIYCKILEMRDKVFCDLSPYSVVSYDSSMADVAAYMSELVDEYDFEMKKMRYNLNLYLTGTDERPKYTTVTFSDYVTRFISLYVSSFKRTVS